MPSPSRVPEDALEACLEGTLKARSAKLEA
jgi:hypothetical protein